MLLSALSGVDWSQYGVDRPIEQFDTDASRSILAAVADSDDRHRLTLRDYVGGLGGFGGELFVGSGAGGCRRAGRLCRAYGCRRLQHRLSRDTWQLRRRGRVSHSRTAAARPQHANATARSTLRQRLFPGGSDAASR